MSLYLSLFRKQKTRVGILCWPLLEEVYCAHIHVSSLGETCWKPVNTLFKLKYLRLHCVAVGNLHNDDRDYQTASYNVGFMSGLGILLVLELNCYLGKKNVNLEMFSCHMLNPPAESECHVWIIALMLVQNKTSKKGSVISRKINRQSLPGPNPKIAKFENVKYLLLPYSS